MAGRFRDCEGGERPMLKISLLLSDPVDTAGLFARLRDWSPWCPPTTLYDPYLKWEFVNDREFRRVIWNGTLLLVELRRDHEGGQARLTIRLPIGTWLGIGAIGLVALVVSLWLLVTAHQTESVLRPQLVIWGSYLGGSGIYVAASRKEARQLARAIQPLLRRELGIASRLS